MRTMQSLYTSLALIAMLTTAACSNAEKTKQKDMAAIQGSWIIEQALKGGKPMNMGVAYVEVQNNTMDRITTSGTHKRRFFIDASTSPRSIDLEILDETNHGKFMAGIYKIENEKLWICHGPVGGSRPKAFESTEADGNVLTVSKRVPR